MTYNGKTCQRWDTESPHDHFFIASDFPDETSLTDINNYCRNANYDQKIGVWCFTTDANVEWEHCVIPVCNGT